MATSAPTASRRVALTGLAAGGVVAVVALVAGLLHSGAAAATALLDPGAVVRWGLPTATVLSELAVSVTLGALMLLAVVLPPAAERAWRTTTLAAAVAAGVWTVLAVANLVLGYASVSGTPLDSPVFGDELWAFITGVPLGLIRLATVVVAMVTSMAALLVRGPRAALVLGLFVLVALAMAAETGHTSGTANHHLAVSALFLHLVGAALWVGGLAALALVSGRLGQHLPAVVRRYSVIAGWCLAGVALSGLVSGMIRVGSVDGLGTPYGRLLIAKVVLLAGLGALGLAHRRAVVDRLEDATTTAATGSAARGAVATTAGARGPEASRDAVGNGAISRTARRLFWRLVAVELVLMGAVSGVAVALGSSAPPVPQEPPAELTPAEIVTRSPLPPPPTVERWLTLFRWEMILAAGCVAAIVVYVRWARRLHKRGDRWPIGRTLSAVSGLVLLFWVTVGGPAVYGFVLFSAHMLQHMVMVMVVPILLGLSAPVTLAARALPRRKDGTWGPRELLLGLVHSRWAGFWAHPIVAAVNFAGSMVAFYFTPAFEFALRTHVGHLLMVAHFTLAGYLFVNALIGIDPGPKRPAYPIRLLLLFGTMVFHAFFGVALVTMEALLVPEWFGLLGRPWGPSAIEDQRTGGAIAWGISEVPMLAIAIGIALMWTKDDERTARRLDRAAERDGDADLRAYNEMLARLGERDASTREGAAPPS